MATLVMLTDQVSVFLFPFLMSPMLSLFFTKRMDSCISYLF